MSRIVVGLGNPGEEYAGTRHNVGQMVADELARRGGAALKPQSKTRTRNATVRIAGEGVVVAVPMSYMNLSGGPVSSLAKYQSVAAEDVVVIHDELDLPFGTVRLKRGGGSAGHNGLKDISARLSSHDYWRLRIGIGHPGDRNEVVNYVLKPPRREEQTEIDDSINRALLAWPKIARGEWAAATQQLNTKPQAQK